MRVLDALDDVAGRLHATSAQVSLAWLMAQPGVTAAIASATSLAQLQDLLAATRLTLDELDMRELDEAGA
jgi:aryl-alcohol dehydrogenase-like predicted oxidoreductase